MYQIIRNFTLSVFILSASMASAQKGIIRGQIIDDATGEALIGATVLIEGTTIGSATDLDGKFSINNVNVGTYNLQASYISYQTQSIKNVEVKEGEVTLLNIRLKTEAIGLEEVVVQAAMIRSNESSLLTIQKKSSVVLDAISSQQFSRTGDNDAASAMRRVTGVSVEGGKYVFVRGLGDRYSKTALNNAEVPGLDPNKNTVQMDLFPSNLIDNMVVYKTFSPELPASFSGGYVNITTKDFPDQFTFQFSSSLGYNTNATFNENFLSQSLTEGHALAITDKNRALPQRWENPIYISNPTSEGEANLVDKMAKAAGNGMSLSTQAPSLDRSFSLSMGNQKTLFGKPIGFITGMSYARNFEYYGEGKTGRYLLPGETSTATELTPVYLLNDEKGTDNVLIGGLLNVSYKLNDNNKIGINLTHNRSSEVSSRYQDGLFPFNTGSIDPTQQLQLRSMTTVQRDLSSIQLKSDHLIPSLNALKIDWMAAYTQSAQDEPNLRYTNNIIQILNTEDTFYSISNNNVKRPTRYFRALSESNIDSKINFELPVNYFGTQGKLKFGGAYIQKSRTFSDKAFEYYPSNPSEADNLLTSLNGDFDQFFDQYLGWQGGAYNNMGLTVRNALAYPGAYEATERTPAAYLMSEFELRANLKMTAGVRFERTDIDLTMTATDAKSNLVRNDFLPALNLTYNYKENSNLRMGYGRTIARPTFRELARLATFNFLGDFIEVGNPDLERTIIDNLDIRWEMYPQRDELISISAFYKKFQNPIEKAVNPLSNDLALEYQYRNVPEAFVVGTEIEARKSLAFISPALTNFKLGTNLTFLYSQVDIAEGELSLIRVNDPTASSTRPLFGQAPFIINSYLNYSNNENGWNANLNFNVLGQRLTVASVGGTPNIYEQARPLLDFNISKKMIANKLTAKFSTSNLLDSEYRFTQEFKGQKYDYQSYRLGRNFSLSLSYLIE